MLVRREQPADEEVVHAVVAAAFAGPDPADFPAEVTLLRELRADAGWLDALSLVADGPVGNVVGHVVCTRGAVEASPALGLGPLAVRPDWQRRGVGSALMNAVLGAAEALDEGLIALLGEPDFYARFGFRASTEYGILAPDPDWGRYFQVRLLSAAPPPTGRFRYAEPFQRL